MPVDQDSIDAEKLKASGQKVFGLLSGALISAMIHPSRNDRKSTQTLVG